MPCNCQRPRWNEEETALIHKHYGRMPTKDLAAMLNRTVKSVMDKAGREGLAFPLVTRPEEMQDVPVPRMDLVESLDCIRLRKWAHGCANRAANLAPLIGGRYDQAA